MQVRCSSPSGSLAAGSRGQWGSLQLSSLELCERRVASLYRGTETLVPLNHGAPPILPVISAVGNCCALCDPHHPSERMVHFEPGETCGAVRGALFCDSGKRQPDPGRAAFLSDHHREPKGTCTNTEVQYVATQPRDCWEAIFLLGFSEDFWDLLCSWGTILFP